MRKLREISRNKILIGFGREISLKLTLRAEFVRLNDCLSVFFANHLLHPLVVDASSLLQPEILLVDDNLRDNIALFVLPQSKSLLLSRQAKSLWRLKRGRDDPRMACIFLVYGATGSALAVENAADEGACCLLQTLLELGHEGLGLRGRLRR